MRRQARPAARGAPGHAGAARRGARRGAREGQAAGVAPSLRRGDEPARDPQAVRGAARHRGHADVRPGGARGRLPPHEGQRASHPAAADDDEPR